MEGPKNPDNSLFEKRNSNFQKNLFFSTGNHAPASDVAMGMTDMGT